MKATVTKKTFTRGGKRVTSVEYKAAPKRKTTKRGKLEIEVNRRGNVTTVEYRTPEKTKVGKVKSGKIAKQAKTKKNVRQPSYKPNITAGFLEGLKKIEKYLAPRVSKREMKLYLERQSKFIRECEKNSEICEFDAAADPLMLFIHFYERKLYEDWCKTPDGRRLQEIRLDKSIPLVERMKMQEKIFKGSSYQNYERKDKQFVERFENYLTFVRTKIIGKKN